nr:MAG TPA: Translation initiation factor eIF-2B epsilon repeat, aa motif, TRANSLATION.3A [Caudoviricetes sp.]
MWTWSFELADVLTTLTIISTLGGMAYYLVIRPFLQWLEEAEAVAEWLAEKEEKKE